MKPHRYLRFLAAVLIFSQAIANAEPENTGIGIEVKKNGETVIVDASFLVPASQREVWEVMTDFDHMAKFLPNLQSSKVIVGGSGKVQVEQKGRVAYGLMSFAFDNVREVELAPYREIRSHQISGNLKKGDGTTQLLVEGAGTRVVYHNESLPGFWLGAAVSLATVEKASREQFEAMRNEILRRKAVSNGESTGSSGR